MRSRGNWQTANPIPPDTDPPDDRGPGDCGWCGNDIWLPAARDGWPLCKRCLELEQLDLNNPEDIARLMHRTIEAEDQRDVLRRKVRRLEARR